MSLYADSIQEILDEMGREADPRHIEAYIRLEHSTMDHLSAQRLRLETQVALGCIDLEGTEIAESLAKSYGL